MPEAAQHEEASTQRRASWFVRSLLNLHEVAVLLSTVGLVLGLFGRFHFLPDLATHFRVQAVCVLLYAGVVLLLFRRHRFGLLGVILGASMLLTLVPLYLPRTQSPAPTDARVRFMVMNVLTRNPSKQQVVDYIKKMSPDVFVLLEVNDRWSDAIRQSLSAEWPHQVHQPRSDNFGVLMCSKQKPSMQEVTYYGPDHLPSVEAVIRQSNGMQVRFVGTHPLPPMGMHNWNSRNQQMSAVAASISKSELRSTTLLAGDLNCTCWSSFYKEWIAEAGLHDSALGYGVQPTWYVAQFFLTALPIDHVLLGDDLEVQDRIVGPDLGSDHRAIVVDVLVGSR